MTDEHSEVTNGSARDAFAETPTTPSTTASHGAGVRGRGPFDLNAQQKKVLLVVLVVHLIVARITLRDLRRRPASAVRGPKRLWRIWASMNTTGSIAYWLVGRRR